MKTPRRLVDQAKSMLSRSPDSPAQSSKNLTVRKSQLFDSQLVACDARDGIEVRVSTRDVERNASADGDGGDEQIVSRHRDSLIADLTRESGGGAPILRLESKVMTEAESLRKVGFLLGTHAGEEFEPDWATIGGLGRFEKPRHRVLRLRISAPPQELDPQRRINDLHTHPRLRLPRC